jgi:cytochrome c oxidase subunit IV
MPSAFRPCTRVFLILITLTGITYAVGELRLGGLPVSLSVLGLALLKGSLVGDYFMGLHGLRGPWRWVIVLWLLLLGGLIALAFTLTT